ncbi:hypothetical protein [Amycolatopsis sulphurea]|uniref:hypothetical protein n=1 Tax=Amycolatopsis sulphurea TaxID=76022 RepID=UPI001FE88E39|nr:hypothetical protein [Amycolatopsis sulphurea]
MHWRDGRWVHRRHPGHRFTCASEADFNLWVRRTDRVLSIRARAGTTLYSTDPRHLALLHGIADV